MLAFRDVSNKKVSYRKEIACRSFVSQSWCVVVPRKIFLYPPSVTIAPDEDVPLEIAATKRPNKFDDHSFRYNTDIKLRTGVGRAELINTIALCMLCMLARHVNRLQAEPTRRSEVLRLHAILQCMSDCPCCVGCSVVFAHYGVPGGLLIYCVVTVGYFTIQSACSDSRL